MGALAKKLAPKIAPAAVPQVRILTLDIENAPNLAHVWSLFNQNVSLARRRVIHVQRVAVLRDLISAA